MNTRRLLLLLCLTAWHATQADPELDRLAASYQTAIDRATDPIRRSYEAELRKLLERQTKSGKLDAAIETKAALEKLTGKPEVVAGESQPAAITKDIMAFFVDKTWAAPKGTRFTFRSSRICVREFDGEKVTLRWRVHA